jgi:hypothetical protein
VALQQTSIWTSAIGVEKFENANSAIEDMLYAPGAAGAGRKAKQQVPPFSKLYTPRCMG